MTEIAQAQKRTIDRMQVRLEHLDKLLSLAGEVIITSANLQDLERRATRPRTRAARCPRTVSMSSRAAMKPLVVSARISINWSWPSV